uniref:Uncharacterized protein n=1 Tax=Steinernema glaseri TaxID=37863 RepID=A0A1I7XZ64_9BILA
MRTKERQQWSNTGREVSTLTWKESQASTTLKVTGDDWRSVKATGGRKLLGMVKNVSKEFRSNRNYLDSEGNTAEHLRLYLHIL